MEPSTYSLYLLAVAAAIAVVGAIDAAIGRQWDALAIFCGLAAILIGLVVMSRWGRPGVPVRADLVAWLRHRSLETAEPVGLVADRAISQYRMLVDHRGAATSAARQDSSHFDG